MVAALSGGMNKDSFATIETADLDYVVGGMGDIGGLLSSIGSFMGPKGQAVMQGIGGIWNNVKGIIGAFQGGGGGGGQGGPQQGAPQGGQ
jgi:hypothetical protein